jgi:FHS family glucose/mannose:H+ symporter-like MFS transporter
VIHSALPGFLLSGFLLALLGAILPAWEYHRDPADFTAVGNYFLSLAVGIVGTTFFAQRAMKRRGVNFVLVLACVVSAVALAYLSMVYPPLSTWWRVGGMLLLGAGSGLLNLGLFHALSGDYTADVAGTIVRGGIWYGLGCFAATILAYLYPGPGVLLVMVAAPTIFAFLFRRGRYPEAPRGEHPSIRQAFQDFRSPGAILFALLLFFQFGNEWSIAGWLPLLLMRRIGLSAKEALIQLALYWLFLMGGRVLAVAMLPRVRHGRLLLGSVASALLGCLILYFTDNRFGAASGVFFLGAGYASIYPLVAEAIGRRFPYYHPGFFNGIFSLALVGGLLAPATVGYAAELRGVRAVIGIPLVGTFLVMLLVPLIWLEAKVTGR